jgi:hypothetical protein
MRTLIIDENSGNPFPARVTLVDRMSTGFSPASTDGYYHNDELIKATTKKLAEIVGLRSGQRTIDVGYGSNLSVAEAMQELGMEAYGLDSQDGLDHQKYQNALFVPPHFNAMANGVRKYCGTVEDLLSVGSQLRNQKFDLFTFWGSWESGGYNFAIGGEWGEARIREERPEIAEALNNSRSLNDNSHELLYNAMQANRDKIITDASSLLNPKGGIIIVSSRYAGHGAGFTTEQLPWEKRIMLRLGQTFFDKGAKEVYFIGVSNNNVQKQLGENPEFADVATALRDDAVLFGLEREVYEAKCPDKMLRAIKDMQVPLGRIDVVYGRF